MSSTHRKLHRQQKLTAHAHRMRMAPSEPERVLWQALRCRQLGVQFRRQVVLQGYIVDFFAPSARLVVEVDARSTRASAVLTTAGSARFRPRGSTCSVFGRSSSVATGKQPPNSSLGRSVSDRIHSNVQLRLKLSQMRQRHL